MVLDRLLAQALGVLQAEAGSIMLLEEATQELCVLAAYGPRAEAIRGRCQRLGQGIAGWVALYNTPLLLHGSTVQPSISRICDRQDVRDALCVPLIAEERTIGVISLNNRVGAGPFRDQDLELLTVMANQAALAVHNARLFDQTQRQRQALDRLLSELVWAQEEERKRMAFGIHDGPAQTLFAASRCLDVAEKLAPEYVELKQEIATAREYIQQAVTDLRGVMTDLRPLGLDDLGLVGGLRQYARHLSERSGLSIVVSRRGMDRRLPGPVEVTLYRIAQEALTNVWKHAQAQQVQVIVDLDCESCTLEVVDDGKGFDPQETAGDDLQHLGLASIRDRVAVLGGQLKVSSAPGSGSSLRVHVAV